MIYYVRHGQTINNVEHIFYDDTAGPGLTELGVQQATTAAEQLKDIKFDICYCSPKQRAIQTMQIITQHHPDLKVIYDARLAERSHGCLGGQPGSVLSEEQHAQRWQLNAAPYADEESLDAVYARVEEFLDAINDPTKNILVVAHGGLYKLVHCYFHGFPADGDLKPIGIPNCGCMTFARRNVNS